MLATFLVAVFKCLRSSNLGAGGFILAYSLRKDTVCDGPQGTDAAVQGYSKAAFTLRSRPGSGEK